MYNLVSPLVKRVFQFKNNPHVRYVLVQIKRGQLLSFPDTVQIASILCEYSYHLYYWKTLEND